MKLHVDIETYSSIDLRKSGLYKYCRSLDFEILMIAYAFDDEDVKMVDLARGEKIPKELKEALENPKVKKAAHNATFERQCFEQYGFKTEPNEWECTMVKSAYCGLPLSLEKISSALRLEEKGKLTTGKALIRYFCLPCKPTKTNGKRERNLPDHDLDKWEEFKEYCINDVVAEREIDNRLAKYKIPKFERINYEIDQKINDRGVKIDLNVAKNAVYINNKYSKMLLDNAKEITGLENPNSPAQLKQWLSDAMEKEITTLAADSVKTLVEETDNETVLEILDIRKKTSKSSIKKYIAMLECASDDERARGLFQFYGANRTGRWAGRLIQLQNLPRNYLPLLEMARELVELKDYDGLTMIYDNLSRVLSQLIRTSIVAREGHTLAIADFSAIEARVIAWLANEQWRLDVFATHGKIYEASASMMFGVPIEQITKGSDLRDKGKIAELALGYQGSVGAMKNMGGESMGLNDSEMKSIVNIWRRENPNIVQLWYDVDEAAKRAVKTKRPVQIQGGKLKFDYDGQVLRIKLPSGRCLFYQQPKFGKNRFGLETLMYKNIENHKWIYTETYGGKLVENITQAVARDLLAYSMQNLYYNGFDIVLHVHDEAGCEVPIETQEQDLERMCELMKLNPKWAKDLPLDVDGFLSPFYKKD